MPWRKKAQRSDSPAASHSSGSDAASSQSTAPPSRYRDNVTRWKVDRGRHRQARAGHVNTQISRSQQALTGERGEEHSVRVSCPAALEFKDQLVDVLFVTFLLRIARVACRSRQREQPEGWRGGDDA